LYRKLAHVGLGAWVLEMAIPDIEAMLLPTLCLAASKREINSNVVVEAIREDAIFRRQFNLTDEELAELLPNRPFGRVRNNAQFAIVHLGRAMLIQKVRPEAHIITDRGRGFLEKNPTKISFDDLRQFPEYLKRKVKTPTGEVEVAVPNEDDELEEAVSTVASSPEAAFPGEPEARQSIYIQAKIAEIGAKMGFRIWIPAADRARVLEIVRSGKDSFLRDLPLNYEDNTLDTIRQIDVLWLKGSYMARAFEIEHTTAIYSGILRMADLLALQPNMQIRLHFVAPIERRKKVLREIKRPVFSLLEQGPLYDKCTFLSYDSIRAISQEKSLDHMKDSILDKYEEHAGT
jgi:hypothetical protein